MSVGCISAQPISPRPCPTFTRFTHVLAWLTTKNKREVSMTISVCDGRLIKITVATALLATVAQPGFGQDLKYKPIAVKTPDGLTISAQEWGNPAGANPVHPRFLTEPFVVDAPGRQRPCQRV